VESADDVRVVCVKSSISGFFCAGADIRDFVKNNIDDKRRLVRLANQVAARMQTSSKLYISAVNGHALGGGLEIMLATDIRLGSDSSYKLGMSEVALGLMPGNGGTQRFARIVGMPRALEYCISGAMITPQKAHSMGLFNQIFPSDGFDHSVSDYCQSIAKGAPLAIAAIKTAVYQGCSMPLCDGLELESTLADSLYDTDDADEGLSAFLE
jgi:enoyl-CoA hydratase